MVINLYNCMVEIYISNSILVEINTHYLFITIIIYLGHAIGKNYITYIVETQVVKKVIIKYINSKKTQVGTINY